MEKKYFYEEQTFYDLWGSSSRSNFFLQHYRYFDLNTKMNGSLNNIKLLPEKFTSNVSLPLVLPQGNNNFKLKTILTCLRVIKLFTFQKSFIKKRLVFQQIKKKNSGFVLQTKTRDYQSFQWFYYYILTIFPYLWISHGAETNIFLSDTLGVISFNLVDVTYFSHLLQEKHLEWERQFTFIFSWNSKHCLSLPRKASFLSLNFIWGMIYWVLWSSLGLKCNWGHGGWLEFSKFSKTIFFSNSKFFMKNFWF